MIKALARFFLSCLLTLFVLIGILVYTQIGLEMLVGVGEEFVPGLKIESAQGRLLGPMMFKNIHYKDEYLDTNVDSVSIVWNFKDLLNQHITLQHLDVTGLKLRFLVVKLPIIDTVEIEKEIKTQFNFPFTVTLEEGNLKNSILLYDDNTTLLTVNTLNIKGFLLPDKNDDAQVSWDKLTVPITEKEILESTEGAMTLKGTLPNYIIDAHSHISLPTMKNGYATLVGAGDLNQISLDRLFLSQDNNHLSLNGEVNWENDTFININSAEGIIDNRKIKAKTKIVFHEDDTIFSPSYLTVDDAHVTLEGKMGPSWDLQWAAQIPNVTTLLPEGKGSFSSKGQITGAYGDLSINALTDINGFTYENYALEKGSLSANLHQNLKTPSDLSLQGTKAKMGDLSIDTLNLAANNRDNHQNIQLAVTSPEGNLTTHLEGSWKKSQWYGVLSQFIFKSSKGPSITLKNSASLALSQTQVKVSSFCFVSLQANFCGEGQWEKDKPWSFHLSGKDINLRTLTDKLSENLAATGIINFDVSAAGQNTKLSKGNATLILSKGTLLSKTDKKMPAFQFNGLNSTAVLDKKGLNINLLLQIPNQSPLTANFNLPQYQDLNADPNTQKLSGTLQFKSTNLAPFTTLLNPKLNNLKGLLAINLRVDGTLSKPTLSGEASLKQGEISVLPLSTTFKNINLSLQSDKKNKIIYKGNLSSGKGTLTLEGNTLLQTSFPTDLSLTGKDFQVMNTDEFKVNVSPSLTLHSEGDKVLIKGDILIPYALITPIDLGNNVTLSKDVEFVDEDANKKSSLLITSEVNIKLGDSILVAYKGLKAKLLGEVTVIDSPGSSTIGKGEIYLEKGAFKAYGQNLNIRKGQLIFSGGPVDNPGLSIEAIKAIRTVIISNSSSKSGDDNSTVNQGISQDEIVGLRVTGTLEEPHITFFSEPSGMSQEDILSYLVLGRPSTGNNLDASLLLKALSFLDGGDSETAETKDKLQRNLGLDELAIQSDQEYSAASQSVVENTSVVLGKALSPQLFLSYSIGLLEPINILRISYKLTDHISVRTESNTNAQGIDVFYTIEKD